MTTKLDVLSYLLSNLFSTSHEQNIISYGQDGITVLSGVEIDNSGDYVRGILLNDSRINKGNNWKEFVHTLVIECNSFDVLDAVIKELEDYSFDAPDPTYRIIPESVLNDYSYDIINEYEESVDYPSEADSTYNGNFTIVYSSADDITYSSLYHAFTDTYYSNSRFFYALVSGTYYKRYTCTFIKNPNNYFKLSVDFDLYYYKNPSDAIIGTRTIRIGYFWKTHYDGLTDANNVATFLKTDAESATVYEEVEFDTTSMTQAITLDLYGTLEDCSNNSDKDICFFLYDATETPANTINYYSNIQLSGMTIGTSDPHIYMNTITPISSNIVPYFITLLEKERSIDESNPNAIIEVRARYSK